MSDTEPRAPRRMVGTRRARLALAVAPDHLTVVRLARGVAGARPVEVLQCTLAPPGRSSWPELEDALRDLADTLRVSGGSVDVALLRRLGHAKVIALPPLRRPELSALVRRTARRHFAVRDEPQVADAARLPGARTGALVPTLAGCAPTALVEAVTAACGAAGFRVGRIVPGAVALAEGARSLAPAARKGRVAVIGCAPEAADLVQVENGTPRLFHPLASAGRVGEALRALEADGAALTGIVVCGSGPEADGVRMELLEDLEFSTRLVRSNAVSRIPAEAVAALGAARATSRAPVLLPDAIRAARAKAARRRTAVLSAAAGVMLIVAAWLHLWGIRHEAEAVAARRREIAPMVKSALEARSNVEVVRARLVTLAALERGAQGWTREIAALARALPDSAHLRTFAADSGGVRLGGIARSASAVVPALEASPAFARVSLAAPVRWEQGDAGERFDVAATLQRAATRSRSRQ
ncbi:MAG TPA: PilN domain-containing protein [Longimicrobium sp.]|nr:PilN domain-containing protein [Longimicrobium sp.]